MPVTLMRFSMPVWGLIFGMNRLFYSSPARVRAAADPSPWLARGFTLRCGATTMIMFRPSCLGGGLDETEFDDLVGQPAQQPETQLGAALLATAEHDRDLDLVARLEESHDVTLLGLVVVRVDLRAELHLLDDGLCAGCAGPRAP